MKKLERDEKRLSDVTREERRAMTLKRITSDKKHAKIFLSQAGIVDKEGHLSKIYK